MKKFVILVSVLMLTFAFISTVPAADIRVGTLMAQTGPLKEYGPPIKDGAVLAGKQMAAAGFEIEWFHEDSETNPAPATNAAKKLVNINNVVAIVGALSSGVTLAVAESVTLPNNVILISPASTNPLMTILPADEPISRPRVSFFVMLMFRFQSKSVNPLQESQLSEGCLPFNMGAHSSVPFRDNESLAHQRRMGAR